MNQEIRPFRIDVPQSAVDDLRRRLDRARWPQQLPGTGVERGITVDRLAGLVERWRTSYDWRAHQTHLNRYPQFVTEIDGQQVHFLHVRSADPDALPLLLTHGFPSSVAEFDGLIDRLTDPTSGPAFHVVAPSVPGFAFSTPLAATGWTMGRTAAAWAELMRRLGHERYGVHGGDIGAGISGRSPARTPSTSSASTSSPTPSPPPTPPPSSPAWPSGSTPTTRSTG